MANRKRSLNLLLSFCSVRDWQELVPQSADVAKLNGAKEGWLRPFKFDLDHPAAIELAGWFLCGILPEDLGGSGEGSKPGRRPTLEDNLVPNSPTESEISE